MPSAPGSTTGHPSPSRLPAWMLLLGLAFLGYEALLLYTDLMRPEPLGLVLQAERSAITVRDVLADSLAARAGLVAGDRVVAVNSRRIRSRLDWMSVEMNLQTNQPLRLEIERGGSPLAFRLVPTRATSHSWLTGASVTLAVARFVQLVALMLALTVAFRRPFDPAARVGAWTLATIAVYSITWQYQLAAVWRALPMPIGAALWIPFSSSLAIAAVVFTFFATFPRPLVRSRLAWLAVWVPALTVLALQLQYAGGVVYRPDQMDPFVDWTSISAAVVTAYVVAAIAVVVIGYRRLTDITERRRVRVLVVGSSIGLLCLLPVVALYWGRSPSTFGDSVFASPLAAAGSIVGLALPISFAYAILRHRLFDIRLMLRLGLQYALARRVLVSVVPIVAVVFLADLWINRQAPFAEILAARGWMYGVLAAVAVVARWQRDAWLDALDRRYFREQLNAERLLRGISAEIRNATTLDEIASRVVAQIETALHPEFVALLVCRSGEAQFHTLAISPAAKKPLSLGARSQVAEVIRLMKKTVHFEDRERSWLLRHLAASDIEWLAQAAVETLVPIQLGDQGAEALFALGPKRSEEPYSAEDDDLLMAIADNVAWVLRRAPAPAGTRDFLEECPVCGQCFDAHTGRCGQDGATLTVTPLPRVIGGRYELQRRVGRGGMGSVYAGHDRSLNRSVAVKVLREDLVIPGGAERFQSEARLAAALAHPNVVTVHDIGVTESGRAFFVMELLNGTTLREELRQMGKLPPARVLQIMRDVGAGVDAAHRRQMVHRDLKPENVFLCRDEGLEVAKVLDFGLAKALEVSGGGSTRLTMPGIVAGTPQYMAPEHLSGGEPSSDWDLWSIAVVAFEMITGSLPATGSSRALALDGLPSEGLRVFFAQALSDNPIDRPATVSELVDELERELSALERARL